MMHRVLCLLPLLFVAACSGDLATGTTDVHGVPEVEFTPPPEYATYFHEVEACSGIRGNLTTIRYVMVAPSDTTLRNWTIDDAGHGASGAATSFSDGRATIRFTWRSAREPGTVRHEMLHVLLRGDGHTSPYFLDRCALLVDVHDEYYEAAGRTPPPRMQVGIWPDAAYRTDTATFFTDVANGTRTLAPRGARVRVLDPITGAELYTAVTESQYGFGGWQLLMAGEYLVEVTPQGGTPVRTSLTLALDTHGQWAFPHSRPSGHIHPNVNVFVRGAS